MDSSTHRSLIWNEEGRQPFKRGTNHLVVIGIDKYLHVAQLDNACRDAKFVSEMLIQRYQFDEANRITLYNQEATKEAIDQTFRSLIDKVKPGDNLIVYFSGHGHYDKVLDEAYWVPVDARFNAVMDYLSYTYITKVIKAMAAQHVLLIVDSCYSGAALLRERNTLSERLERDPSRWLLASGRNEVVPDGIAGQHSPFAEKLIDILKRYALEGIRLGSLVDKLTTSVTYNSYQTPIGRPIFGVGDQGGEFIFHPKQNERKDWEEARENHMPESYRGYVRAYPKGKYLEEALWQIASLSKKVADHDAYLEKFPNGQYADEALRQMRSLEEEEYWKDILKRDSLSYYREYLRKYPKGKFGKEAKAKIEALRNKNERVASNEITENLPPKIKPSKVEIPKQDPVDKGESPQKEPISPSMSQPRSSGKEPSDGQILRNLGIGVLALALIGLIVFVIRPKVKTEDPLIEDKQSTERKLQGASSVMTEARNQSFQGNIREAREMLESFDWKKENDEVSRQGMALLDSIKKEEKRDLKVKQYLLEAKALGKEGKIEEAAKRYDLAANLTQGEERKLITEKYSQLKDKLNFLQTPKGKLYQKLIGKHVFGSHFLAKYGTCTIEEREDGLYFSGLQYPKVNNSEHNADEILEIKGKVEIIDGKRFAVNGLFRLKYKAKSNLRRDPSNDYWKGCDKRVEGRIIFYNWSDRLYWRMQGKNLRSCAGDHDIDVIPK